MISVSDKFLEAIRGDHTEDSKVELWVDGSFYEELPVDADNSSITLDRTADVMRYCDLTLAEAWVPGIDPDELWPIGPELKIFSGLIFPDGTEEWIGQGVFRLSKPKSEDDGVVVTKMQGYDRSKVIARNRWTKPYSISGSPNVINAIVDMARNRLPNVDFAIIYVASPFTVPDVTFDTGGESNPWHDMENVAESAGMEVYFNENGDLVIRPVPDPATTQPVFEYYDNEDSVTTKISRELDEERVYSGVIVRGSHPDTGPQYAEAWDTDPLSPTYVNTYGYVPYFIDTQFIKAAEASKPQVIADNKLLQVKGMIENVSFNAVANFAHEQNDVIAIQQSSLNINHISIIDSYRRSLAPGSSLECVTRKTRVGLGSIDDE